MNTLSDFFKEVVEAFDSIAEKHNITASLDSKALIIMATEKLEDNSARTLIQAKGSQLLLTSTLMESMKASDLRPIYSVAQACILKEKINEKLDILRKTQQN